MCGIIAANGTEPVLASVLRGLQNLEYRGYDSAGVAVGLEDSLAVCKHAGQISSLVDDVRRDLPDGTRAIGHTRWSTHGPPTDANAHPHTDCSGRVAVVHNGIIENHEELRAELRARGHEFTSETDTEVVGHLIEQSIESGADTETAVRSAIDRLEGSYAVAVLVEDDDRLFAARRGSPLALGVGADTYYLGSDAPAFLEYTDHVVYLQDGDLVTLAPTSYEVTNDGRVVQREVETIDWSPADARKGTYDHFMLKEIYEQPSAIEQTIQSRLSDGAVRLEELDALDAGSLSAVHFVACGTSYHAGLYCEQLLRERGVDAQTFLASEYSDSPPPVGGDVLTVAVTQSGETADTLEAVRHARAEGATTLAVTNVVGSTVTRECDHHVLIRAGPEIGVAATKTFTSQIATLLLLAEHLVRARDGDASGYPLDALAALPDHAAETLDRSRAGAVARRYADADSYFFIGRGTCYPVALEGALKLKEISYEHAEGFPAGELKHGPLALVTSRTPVIALFSGQHDEKTLSNVEEVQARGAPVVAVVPEGSDLVDGGFDEVLIVPDTAPELTAVLGNLQLQLFAYYVADTLDRAIDKPRNLAKSVTVE
ncbi:glutamine--fructose-6-phosphate transaminase (isomerizing) [Halomicroarcula sp. GCM10025817]|uniref:glutamine--fructose-6-phosphate transaminase (isomerizing) n=1 Tax=Haloarcula TaxID=2237 RepID=UPI0023E7F9F0|nr:glutamine--fructose-6-phosphate transaminase (isomerizing) [Halomicroarcula sp. SYNS111]